MLRERISNFFKELPDIITDPKRRKVFQTLSVFILFTIIGYVMSIINVITWQVSLLIATASFATICLILFFITYKHEKRLPITRGVFMLVIVVLFLYFLISGGTDNFSLIWLILLPTLGLFCFGLLEGSAVCLVVFICMLLVFYVPDISRLCLNYGENGETFYNDTYILRFPVVYVSAYIVAFFLEGVRLITEKRLVLLREKYHVLSNHDQLTQTLNRFGFLEGMEEIRKNEPENIAIVMFDIDDFKKFNDTYGHLVGDKVLRNVCEIAQRFSPDDAFVHRFGGEEFIIVYPNSDNSFANAEAICKLVAATPFDADGTTEHITISMGHVISDSFHTDAEVEKMIMQADEALYEAKRAGKNQVVKYNK